MTNTIYIYLGDVIGLDNDATGLARANAIMDEGLNNTKDLHELHNRKGLLHFATI